MFSSPTFASDITRGTYSLTTEAGWTALIELKDKGEAAVTPFFGTEEDDGPRPAPEKGTWKQILDGLDVTYGKVTDSFRYEPRCKDWPIHPCFYYVKTAGKEKTSFKFKQPFVNWTAGQ